ncbi:hypothetical protein VP395_04125 [Mariniflexile soesokkakense]|uniref:Uncharacterized protein n=1 Tax=Mariniflexile soesokkakense TaxID=1343160 RepID=A0ABV0A8L8_9FLAO
MKLLILLLLISFNIYITKSFGQNIPDNDSISKQESIKESVRFENQPLMIFDDKIIKSSKELNSIDPNTIQELTVYKTDLDEFISKYGEKAKNGIIFICSKHYVANRWFNELSVYSKKLKSLILKNNIEYTNFKIYLNDELLKLDFFDKLDDQLENQTIKKVNLKNFKKDSNSGIIIIKTKNKN